MKNSKQANSRRQFLGQVGGIGAATVAVNAVGLSALVGLTQTTAQAKENGRQSQASKIANDELQASLYQEIGRLKAELESMRENAVRGVYYR